MAGRGGGGNGIGARATAGGLGIGAAVGWNIAALGGVATLLSSSYGVSLATIGLFTTVQFVGHTVMQLPGGRAADRWGARTSSLVGLGLIALGNAIALAGPDPALGFLGRAIVGLGTGFGFVGGADYIRARGGSPLMQGLFGGVAVGSPGVALALVPGFAHWTGFRAPYLSALIVVAVSGALLLAAPPGARTVSHAGERLDGDFVRDRRLYRLAALHCMSFGSSVIVGNWVETLLEHHGQPKSAAAAAGSLTLLLGFFTRPIGGPLLRRADAHRWIAGSLVACGIGCAVLALPVPLGVLVVGAAVVGLAAGLPYALVFTGAAIARPEAPGAAIGFVNAFSSLTSVVGTPLIGFTFSLPGDGRIGFFAVAALSVLAAVATPRTDELAPR